MIKNRGEITNRISAIRDLKMVRLYHLLEESSPIIGIMAYFGDETINLCSEDEHFDELLDRLIQVYSEEAAENRIVVDEETRRILEQAEGLKENEYVKKLEEFREIKEPLFLPKAFFHQWILPIAKYVLAILYGSEADVGAFEKTTDPWFGQGVLCRVIGENTVRIPYKIIQVRDNLYEVTLCNVLKTANVLKMQIFYGREFMKASFSDRSFSYRGLLELAMRGEEMYLSCSILEGDKTIYTKEEVCSVIEGAAPTDAVLKLTAGRKSGWKTYELPWGERVYRMQEQGNEYLVYETGENGDVISRAVCCECLTQEVGGAMLKFGRLAFQMYEREQLKELHLLDLEYPGSGRYRLHYAGKYYTVKSQRRGEEKKNGDSGE